MAQEFHDWKTKGLKTIHLTYHRGRHYNSVRSCKDPGWGPAFNHPIEHPLMKAPVVKAAEDKPAEEAKNLDDEEERKYDYLLQDTVYDEDDNSSKTRQDLIEIACRLAGVD